MSRAPALYASTLSQHRSLVRSVRLSASKGLNPLLRALVRGIEQVDHLAGAVSAEGLVRLYAMNGPSLDRGA